MIEYKVIDNFLDEETFNSLLTFFTGNGQVTWFFQSGLEWPKESGKWRKQDELFFYMYHMFYRSNIPVSPFFDILYPLLKKLEVKSLLQVKANLWPNAEMIHEHPMHKDLPFSHLTALLSLNTCDGYTKLKDGTKINSVANRVLLFDAGEDHGSTTTTNVPARFNINVNYF